MAATASMSAMAVNLSRGRSLPPRAISACVDGLPARRVDDVGLPARTNLSSAERPRGRDRSEAPRCSRRRGCGRSRAAHDLLVPMNPVGPRLIQPATYDTRRPRRPGHRRWARPRRPRRTGGRESACRGSRSTSAPARPRARDLVGPGDGELDALDRGRRRARAAGSAGRPAGSGAARSAPTRRPAWPASRACCGSTDPTRSPGRCCTRSWSAASSTTSWVSVSPISSGSVNADSAGPRRAATTTSCTRESRSAARA